MKRRIDKLVNDIAEKLQTLPPTVQKISTKKLLNSIDVGGYSPRSIWNAVSEVEAEGWCKAGRCFLRITASFEVDNCKCLDEVLPVVDVPQAETDGIEAEVPLPRPERSLPESHPTTERGPSGASERGLSYAEASLKWKQNRTTVKEESPGIEDVTMPAVDWSRIKSGADF